MDRLPWQRNPEGGFIAYPEGEHLKGRVATISYDTASALHWRWWIGYDAAKKADHAATMQGAADAATEAWPKMRERAAELAGIAAEEERLRTDVRRMCAKGDLSLAVFRIEDSPTDRLTHIIWLVKDAHGLTGPAKPLVEACSAELGRRRKAGSAP